MAHDDTCSGGGSRADGWGCWLGAVEIGARPAAAARPGRAVAPAARRVRLERPAFSLHARWIFRFTCRCWPYGVLCLTAGACGVAQASCLQSYNRRQGCLRTPVRKAVTAGTFRPRCSRACWGGYRAASYSAGFLSADQDLQGDVFYRGEADRNAIIIIVGESPEHRCRGSRTRWMPS